MRLSLVLLALAPMIARAQGTSPTAESRDFLLAVGADLFVSSSPRPPLALGVGLEQGRLGSRWILRLGADYLREESTSPGYDVQREDFGVAAAARYGRLSGALRPYALGGLGVANLRSRGKGMGYVFSPDLGYDVPADGLPFATSRWNGFLLAGVGLDVRLGHMSLFVEQRASLYPARLSSDRRHSSRATKALFLGVKL